MPPTWASAPQPPPDSLPRQRMSPPGKEAQGAANTEGKRGAMRSGSSEYHELVSSQPPPASYPVPVATPTSLPRTRPLPGPFAIGPVRRHSGPRLRGGAGLQPPQPMCPGLGCDHPGRWGAGLGDPDFPAVV